MFFLAWTALAAGYTGPAVARFRWALTEDFLARLDEALGYAPREVVAGAHPGLLLFLTPAINATLSARFPYSIRSLEPLHPLDRCSPSVASFGENGEFLSVPAARTSLGPGPPPNGSSVPSSLVPATLTVRVLLHEGALLEPTDWAGRIQLALAETLEDRSIVSPASLRHQEPSREMYIDHVPREILSDLAMHLAVVEGVCWIEPVYTASLVNLWSSRTAQSGAAMPSDSPGNSVGCSTTSTCSPLWSANVRGQNQLIAVSDTGLSSNTCMFLDSSHSVPFTSSSSVPADTNHRKIRSYWSFGDSGDSDGHGSHVAGTAAGSPVAVGATSTLGLRAGDFAGVAPGARLVFIDIQAGSGGLIIPSPYDTNLLQHAYNAGARIHTGSWGISDWLYSTEDRQVDLFCWNHRSFLAIFAAGNSGATRGIASILSPGLAKNALAVGAAMNGFAANDIASGTPAYAASLYAYDWVASFSSRGGGSVVPWMKPDLLGAGGEYVWSANAFSSSGATCGPLGDVVVGYAGTSMAAPHVAGAAALVRQYFMEGRGGGAVPFEPMASVVKAVLAASATPTRGVFPGVPMSPLSGSYGPYGRGAIEGHGRIDLSRTLHVGTSAGRPLVLSNEGTALPASGTVARWCLALSGSGTANVSIALSWTDYPTTVSVGLVNDLDLRVFIRDPVTNAVTSSFLTPNGLAARDSSSTMEVLRLSNFPATHRIQIDVRAALIGYLSQSFGLVLSVHDKDRSILSNGLPASGPAGPASQDPTGICSRCSDGSFRSSCSSTPPTSTSTTPTTTSTTPTTTSTTPITTSTTLIATTIPVTTSTTSVTSVTSSTFVTSTNSPATPSPTSAACSGTTGIQVAGIGGCVCYPGWSGSGCLACATTGVVGLTNLCVGLVPSRRPAGYTNVTHVLVPVTSSTVSPRLAGTYYLAGQGKPADRVPGTGTLDCWCLPLGVSLPSRSFPSPGAAASVAMGHLRARDALIALAIPLRA